LNVQALETIAKYPLQGSYASYEPGSYAHNILSAWVDLGLFGFLALVALLLWPLQRLLVQCFLRRNMGQDVELPLCLCCTTVLLLLGSHHYHDMLIAATLGSYELYNSRYRADSNRSSQFSASAA
jgi:O-antigen ligase